MDEDSDLLHLTTDAQWQRAVKFEAEVNQAKAEGRQAPDATIVGIRGLSLFPGILWYSDCNTLFTMPFCHKFFRGVLRNFLIAIIEGPDKKKYKKGRIKSMMMREA